MNGKLRMKYHLLIFEAVGFKNQKKEIIEMKEHLFFTPQLEIVRVVMLLRMNTSVAANGWHSRREDCHLETRRWTETNS